MHDVDRRSDYYDLHQGRFVAEWRELLSFPSISADPDRDEDCVACARWLLEHVRAMGFTAELRKTPGKPVLVAERPGNPGLPSVLFYGHYDVQPVDPLDAWISPPFEPEIRNGRLYARGAQDNKGQLFYALKAMETLIQEDALAPTVKIVIEGEEEYGSVGISASLPGWKDDLRADVLMVADTITVPSHAPTIIMGLRGILHLTAVLSGPSHDLHSGVHGGRCPNPAAGIAQLVASLHDASGRIAVPGFYDAVRDPTDHERELANSVSFDPADYRKNIGAAPVAGEQHFTPIERTGFRPSLDINGIGSGYQGSGMKTVIPTRGEAKITARLVPDQDPETCLKQIIHHLENNTPPGLVLTIPDQGAAGAGFRLDPDSGLTQLARSVLEKISGESVAFQWEGASIPVVAELARISGAEPLLVGFGHEEDRIHAPNESFSLEQFRLGYLYVAGLLSALETP